MLSTGTDVHRSSCGESVLSVASGPIKKALKGSKQTPVCFSLAIF